MNCAIAPSGWPRTMRICVCCVLAFAALAVVGCGGKKAQSEMPPRPVQTGTVVQKDVPIYIDSFGTFASLEDVDIKAEVTEAVKEVHFIEGQDVTNGQLLFTIDPRTYKAALDKAKAELTEDLVRLKMKNDDKAREKKLFETAVISAEEYERAETAAAAAAAAVALDEAELQIAQINVDHCYIRSPINGRTGKRLVDPGNIVEAYTGPTLVNIKRVDPLYLDFTIPERHLYDVKTAMANAILRVEITVEGDAGGPYTGELHFLDNLVDDDTGTISLRATVANKERNLWPGQFVHVRLITGVKKNAVVAPYEAVQLGRQGHYLFAVTAKKTAELHLLTVGQREGDYIIIEKGADPGEKVVTVGQLGLSPGVPVAEVPASEQNKAGATAGKQQD